MPSTATIRRCVVCLNPSKGHPKPKGKQCQQLPATNAEEQKLLKQTKNRDNQKTEETRAKCKERKSESYQSTKGKQTIQCIKMFIKAAWTNAI